MIPMGKTPWNNWPKSHGMGRPPSCALPPRPVHRGRNPPPTVVKNTAVTVVDGMFNGYEHGVKNCIWLVVDLPL